MSHPATAVKQSDGTYVVRIQHTIGGSVTEVQFTNVLFAEVLANGYAAMLNGQAVVEAQIGKIASDAGPALADATEDIKKMLGEAETEAQKLLAAARLEAQEIKTEASAALSEAKTEALSLLNEARTEASKLIKEAAAKLEPTSAPKSAAPVKPAASDEDEA